MKCKAGKATRAARLGAAAGKVLTCAAAPTHADAGQETSAAAPTFGGMQTSAGGAGQG
jgi:hypothetical protein